LDVAPIYVEEIASLSGCSYRGMDVSSVTIGVMEECSKRYIVKGYGMWPEE
jgi:hypothetical protein